VANIVANGIAAVAATVLRSAGKMRGTSRAASAINGMVLAMGASRLHEIKLNDGSRLLLDLRSVTQYQAYYSGEFDDLWVSIGSDFLNDGELYLDVGANIGVYGARVGTRHRIAGQVHCFEPLPSNIARLRANIAANGAEQFVTVHEFGLSDADARLPLLLREDFVGGSDTGNASIQIGEEFDPQFQRVEIEVRRLDDHAAILGGRPVGVIKVDVEGHEDQFFKGAADIISRDRPIIIAEIFQPYLDQKGVTAQYVYQDCLPASYTVYRDLRKHEVPRGARPIDHLVKVGSFAELGALENILLCPNEKCALLA
jgi:FkbM family methyltransferase